MSDSQNAKEPNLIDLRWTVIGPSGVPIMCGLYCCHDGHVELICHHEDGPEALIRSQLVTGVEEGRELANEWLIASKAMGFTEVKGGH